MNDFAGPIAATDYPLLNVFWTMLWFFLWVLFLMLIFRIIADIFRDDRLSGWGKAGWSIFVIVLPFLGAFVYLIARGRGMGERDLQAINKRDEQFRSYVRETAGTPTSADELAKLAQLRDHGDISEAEYQQAKTKVLA
ncbi:putative oligomerization/nucleic acid binding protein [Actinomadura pelletieri DSM 43383]|uniref:Putative oligomerization/nucleic acid binding protein n=1 Tax=Actinomadura pelletieri DSM 43383 TaxID=1120940 RepID=A0A495QGT5_9ACTN|nr:SHOCT domain-containing protein [Actinomadura pelletieri]RKS71038.1 putative oligomerization/nucleic acid binding protein [Actinomadura pelletieri DSM 43383]